MASLQRLREPFAVILLVALGLRVVAAVVQVPFYVRSIGSLVEALLAAASALTNPVLVLAAGAAAIWCTWPRPTPRARGIVLLALVVTGISTLGSLIVTVARLGSAGPIRLVGFVESLTLFAVALVTVVALFAVLRDLPHAPAAYASPVAPPVPPGPRPPADTLPPVALPPVAPPPPDPHRPTWSPDQATGAVWRTAGEAASGAPASQWHPDGPAGPAGSSGAGRSDGGDQPPGSSWSTWQPIPRPPVPPAAGPAGGTDPAPGPGPDGQPPRR